MSKTTWITLLSIAVLPGFAVSDDDWQGGSRRLRLYYERSWGEPLGEGPAWARDRGYWDGNYGTTPPWYRTHQLPAGYYHSYAPAPNWRGDRDDNDRRQDYLNRLQDRRERQEVLRKQQRNVYIYSR